jgi:hypothetical protein
MAGVVQKGNPPLSRLDVVFSQQRIAKAAAQSQASPIFWRPRQNALLNLVILVLFFGSFDKKCM